MGLFVDFASFFFIDSVPSNNIRKVKGVLDNLYLEKQKLEKGDKPKKSKGGKVKARLKLDGENVSC